MWLGVDHNMKNYILGGQFYKHIWRMDSCNHSQGGAAHICFQLPKAEAKGCRVSMSLGDLGNKAKSGHKGEPPPKPVILNLTSAKTTPPQGYEFKA